MEALQSFKSFPLECAAQAELAAPRVQCQCWNLAQAAEGALPCPRTEFNQVH